MNELDERRDDDATAKQEMRIFINEHDRWNGKPLFIALLEMIRTEGGAGATVLRGLAGYSANQRRINLPGLADIMPHLPLVVIVVDDPETVARLLPRAEAMVAENGGMISVVDVAAFRYIHPSKQEK